MGNIYLYNTPINNHGCRGFEVQIEPVSQTEGIVRDGESCGSCWQVGHDNRESPIEVGSRVRLPDGWTWETASVPTGYSHNELVDDRDDPQPDSTAVHPYDLTVI